MLEKEEKSSQTDQTCEILKEFKKHTGLRDVRFTLAVGSGKGGVGKTTISAIIGLALKEAGYSVGIFDLDFYGPNTNLVLGIKDKKPVVEFGKIKPVIGPKGIKILSLALMISESEPIFMRGLMASKFLQELLGKVEWGPLDFLILDLPPGTGDVFLTVLDLFALDGFILVTTSHKLSLADAKRTLVILKEKRVPVLGIVKNMDKLFEDEKSFYEFVEKMKLPLLFELPFLQELSFCDSLAEVFLLPEKRDILKTVEEKILAQIFRFR